MKVVKLEDVEKLRGIAQKLRDLTKKRKGSGALYALSPKQLDLLVDRLEELAFEVDNPEKE
jgi:hypothetical protein